MDVAPTDLNQDFKVGARGIEKLLARAEVEGSTGISPRLLEDTSRLAKYSIQFQGCHHLRHWNNDADDGDDGDVRVMTKRLVRFRLVPFEHCSSYNPWMDNTAINNAKNLIGQADYGDYVVDMATFIEAYLEAKEESEGDDAAAAYGYGYEYDAGDDGIDVADYTGCAAFQFNNYYANNNGGDDDGNAADDAEYYLGPYCANQGGELRLQLFSDNSCSTVARCNNGSTRGADCYYQATKKTLPFTTESIVENPCVPCSENYSYLNSAAASGSLGDIDFDEYNFGYARDVCTELYDLSGKCEKYMNNGQYNYGCKYIQGIQMGVSSEGYAIGVKRSLPADGAIGALAISVTFLGMYVYYLKYKLRKVEMKNYGENFYVPSSH